MRFKEPLTIWRVAQLSNAAKGALIGNISIDKQSANPFECSRISNNTRKSHKKHNKKNPTSIYQMSLYPSKSQKTWMQTQVWVAAVAQDYCLWLLREQKVSPNILRKVVAFQMTHPSSFFAEKQHDRDLFYSSPIHLRLSAVKSFLASHKNVYNNPQFGCYGSFGIQKENIQRIGLSKLKISDMSPENIHISKRHGRNMPIIANHVKVVYRCDGKFILHIPCTINHTRRPPTASITQDGIASVDPGISTFASVFSTRDNSFYKALVKEERDDIFKKWHAKQDQAQIRLGILREKNKKGQPLNDLYIYLSRIRLKLYHLIKNLHAKLARWFVENFKTVIIGKYSPENQQNIKPFIGRWATTLLHTKFRDTLRSRSRGTNCEIYVVNEYRTSKKCCNCGHLHRSLGASRVYKCRNCNIVLDRDMNAAINILKKSVL